MASDMTEETWRKERMYGAKPDEVLWALVTGTTPETFRVIGSTLKEADADAILKARNAERSLAGRLKEALAPYYSARGDDTTDSLLPIVRELAVLHGGGRESADLMAVKRSLEQTVELLRDGVAMLKFLTPTREPNSAVGELVTRADAQLDRVQGRE